jgi:hypothetical protein
MRFGFRPEAYGRQCAFHPQLLVIHPNRHDLHSLELFADYYQFHIQDESADGNLSDAWTEEAFDRLLAVAPGTVGIGTVRNMDVPITIDILDREPKFNSD